jgi:hypothetical protein
MAIKNKGKILKDLENFSEITDVSFDHEGSHLAVCHRAQGHGANGWKDIALLMKSEDIEVNADILKALSQVTVELSMEEFLVRFFGLYWSDAEKLTHLLGMETEFEYYLKEQEEYEEENHYEHTPEQHREYLDEKVSHIKLMKSLEAFKDFNGVDPKEYLEILKTQIKFEQGLKIQESIEEIEKSKKPKSYSNKPKPKKEIQKQEDDNSMSSETEVKQEQELEKADVQVDAEKVEVEKTEAPVSDVTKSAEYMELLKRMEELEKKAARAEELEKAQKANLEKSFQSLTKSLTFVADEQKDELVKGLMENVDNPVVDTLVGLLQKAQEELNKAKEEFAIANPGAEVGAEESKEEDQTAIKKSSLAERITAKFGQKEWL